MINVGIIGCGSITKLRHAPEYKKNEDCNILGFYDTKLERAEKLAEEFGGKAYSTYEEMLSDEEIDAVSICTANAYHAPITIEALNHGKHVLCEKPMAMTVEEAESMIKAAKDADRYLMIDLNQRLVPAHIKAKEILKSGELGEVLSFKAAFGHKGPEYWSVDKNASTWFFNKNVTSAGVIGDLGIHKADLIRWLLEDEISQVTAMVSTLDKRDNKGELIGVEDNALCILKSAKGIIGSIDVSWTNYGIEENSTELYCKNGVIKIYDNPNFDIAIYKKNGQETFYKVGTIQTNEKQTNSGIIDAFIYSIKNNIPPSISGEDGLAALKIIYACLESSRTGQVVNII